MEWNGRKEVTVIVTSPAVTEIEKDGGKAFFGSIRTYGMVIYSIFENPYPHTHVSYPSLVQYLKLINHKRTEDGWIYVRYQEIALSA